MEKKYTGIIIHIMFFINIEVLFNQVTYYLYIDK